ncbi:MAG: MotA/TolQ/ExbB proton channel family protein [Planctomycetota bacterium]
MIHLASVSETEVLSDRLSLIWEKALEIWDDGGWAMWGIAGIALCMFAIGVHLMRTIHGKGFHKLPESTWRRWLRHPLERRGPVGAILDEIMSRETARERVTACREIETIERTPIDRDLNMMKVFVSAAPLVGLLGTVGGMLATFGALSSGGGGDQTMGLIAQGISEALITTETGLIVALPGIFFHYVLSRRAAAYRGFLTQLESACLQDLFERQHDEREEAIQRLAKARVAQIMMERSRELAAKRALSASKSAGDEPLAWIEQGAGG